MGKVKQRIYMNGEKITQDIDFESAVNLMDDELREQTHNACAPCNEQFFFDWYCALHNAKYLKPFLVN